MLGMERRRAVRLVRGVWHRRLRRGVVVLVVGGGKRRIDRAVRFVYARVRRKGGKCMWWRVFLLGGRGLLYRRAAREWC